TYWRQSGADVKLLDPLHRPFGERLRRQRVQYLDVDGLRVPKWRFGLSQSALVSHLHQLSQAGWHPDVVYIGCFATFWWEGAREATQLAKDSFPGSHVVLTGTYPGLAPEHARAETSADQVVATPRPDLARLPADLSLY